MQEQQQKHIKEPKSYRFLGPVAKSFVAVKTGSWRLERPEVDFSRCSKCGTCERYCPANIITVYKDNEECVRIDWDYCKGCGICANECPKKCISMVDERGESK